MTSGFRIGTHLAELAEVAYDNPAANGQILDALVSPPSENRANAPFLIQLAADFAWLSHPGRFGDVRLETAAARQSAELGTPVGRTSSHQGRPRVLHVLTQAQALGGHTRLVWRWMMEDRNRSHSLALTAQAGIPIPSELANATVAAGGRINVVGGSSIHSSRGQHGYANSPPAVT